MEVTLKRIDYQNFKAHYDEEGNAFISHKPKAEFNLLLEKAVAKGDCPLYEIKGSLWYAERIGTITKINEEEATVEIFKDSEALELQRHKTPIRFMFSYKPSISPTAELGFVLAYVE